jgi:ATP-dependent 26S proteasome regulatory subunit
MFKTDITNYIRAGYPVMNVNTNELHRISQQVRGISELEKLNFACWTVTRGWELNGTKTGEGESDPLACLNSISSIPENTILVIHNFHYYMDDPMIVQSILDLVHFCKATSRYIIFVSAQMDIPIELQKDITVVDFEYPDRTSLGNILSGMAEDNGIEFINSSFDHLCDSAVGMTEFDAENAFALSLVEKKYFCPEIIQREKAQNIKKSGLLEYYQCIENMNSVGGLDVLKMWLAQRKTAFSTEAKEFGLPSPKGILIVGVPGCGKSLTAKAVANSWELPLLKFDMGKLFGSLQGQSEQNMRTALDLAESMSPSVLWIDELEKGLSGINSSGQTDGGVTSRVFGTLITWMNERTKPVFIVATANDITKLPPELLRAGRFDQIFAVDLPNEHERLEIFKIHITKNKRDVKNFDLPILVEHTHEYSGAEIENCIISGMFKAFSNNSELNTVDIMGAIKEMTPLSKSMKQKLDKMREWVQIHARNASTIISDIKSRRKISI